MLQTLDKADVYEILGVKEREDTYTSVIGYLLHASAAFEGELRRYAFRDAPIPIGQHTVRRQARVGKGNILDLLVEGQEAGKRWCYFVETKVHASEHGDQTERYYKACEVHVAPNGRVGGVFLTLTGTNARESRVRPLKHRELAGWINGASADFQAHDVLASAARAYVDRARVDPSKAELSTSIASLLERTYGLVPRTAGTEAIREVCEQQLGSDWKLQVVWIQGRGQGNPGLLLRRVGWSGTCMKDGGPWEPENVDIHLEISVVEAQVWNLKLHFESSPYLPERVLKTMLGSDAFDEMRGRFRIALKQQLASSVLWNARGTKLQVAVHKLAAGQNSTVGQLLAALKPALADIFPRVETALDQARAATPKGK